MGLPQQNADGYRVSIVSQCSITRSFSPAGVRYYFSKIGWGFAHASLGPFTHAIFVAQFNAIFVTLKLRQVSKGSKLR